MDQKWIKDLDRKVDWYNFHVDLVDRKENNYKLNDSVSKIKINLIWIYNVNIYICTKHSRKKDQIGLCSDLDNGHSYARTNWIESTDGQEKTWTAQQWGLKSRTNFFVKSLLTEQKSVCISPSLSLSLSLSLFSLTRTF